MRKKKDRPMRDKTKRTDAIYRDVSEKSFAFVFGMLKFNDIYKALFKKALPHWLLADVRHSEE